MSESGANGLAKTGAWHAVPVVLALAVSPVVGVVAPLGMAPFLIFAGVLSIVALWRRGVGPCWSQPLTLTLAACCLWAVVSVAWAIDPAQAAKGAAKLALNAVLGMALFTAANRFASHWIFPAAVAGLGVALFLLLFEYSSAHAIGNWLLQLRGQPEVLGKSTFNRGVSVVALLCWPVLANVLRRYGWKVALAFGCVTALAILKSDNFTARIAFVAGAVTFGAVQLLPRLYPKVMGWLLVGLILVAPAMTLLIPPPQQSFQAWTRLPTSMHHRLTIWQFSGSRIFEAPILGWGFDASRSIPDGETTVTVRRTEPDGESWTLAEQVLPLHPHNAILQTWMELGAVGALGLAAFCWFLVRRCAALPRPAAALSTLTASFIIMNMSYGFWQSWWQACLWIAAAAAVATYDDVRDRR